MIFVGFPMLLNGGISKIFAFSKSRIPFSAYLSRRASNTSRALTDFIVMMLDPKLGETFGDFTSGTGGFLTSALNYMSKSVSSAEDGEKLQNAVVGQEWKPLPYLLSITNLLLHDIEAPNIANCDSLGTNPLFHLNGTASGNCFLHYLLCYHHTEDSYR